ncbi:MAG: hypothetical protein A3J48_00030 [Candidatus Doudnabacteria bacterium RIFCSPHIGHO2_02_FULL_46_11]|uniref:DUF1573 domain-containing protein n=1 Tax=Candidatus Doudnabacteria bacterium RIFCSPHIGHO2_02_FULL_46_11 TaxID=1817832 RepID=A0A1F5P966_9BACT|nr:MAG: hypothetical protein A3J48_00030 [Candidatus Doudnabacteria bacterium RIFCSPHIGHO2_02_FULL_46_11]
MNKEFKVILVIAAGILVLGGVAAFIQPQNDTHGDIVGEQNGPVLLTADHTSFDFGDISMKNGKVDHIYKIKNTTAEPLEISKLYTSCMCTQVALLLEDLEFGPFGMPGHSGIPEINKTLAPGQEAQVKAIYDPNAHGPAGIGLADRQIIVETKQGSPLLLAFTANVTP